MPHRVQLSRKKGWRIPPNTVKVDRTTKWGNPFARHSDGMKMAPEIAVSSFAAMLRKEKAWFPVPLPWPPGMIPKQMTTVEDVRRELRGKNLACWCKMGRMCHADILLKIANDPDGSDCPDRSGEATGA